MAQASGAYAAAAAVVRAGCAGLLALGLIVVTVSVGNVALSVMAEWRPVLRPRPGRYH
jgi:hypothetical protein